MTETKASASRKPGTIWKASTTPHQRLVDEAAGEARERADHHADQHRDQRRGEADGERGARAVDHPGEEVAAQPVGAERKGRVGEGRDQRPARRSPGGRRAKAPARAAPRPARSSRSSRRPRPRDGGASSRIIARRPPGADARIEQAIGEVDERGWPPPPSRR